ncbi:MAG: L,D-transpeptidase, partial [Akkermansiaceae bacterium]|nr:L,D-transpeptidase [Akkermansiaceae bacterium]
MTRRFLAALASLAIAMALTGCGGSLMADRHHKMIVSVKDQRMVLVRDGVPLKTYKVSTSKFGVGDQPNSNYTPLGKLTVAKKIGGGAPAGAVFKSRRPTGEVIKPNAPGRDPIVSRIIWLRGKESRNRNAFRRYIYIHGTPQEQQLGRPASFGCIRMSSRDVIDLYNRVGYGAEVHIIRGPLSSSDKPAGMMAWVR